MKKLCVLFFSLFVSPALSSGIASDSASAPCTNNTLETYSGNTNLQADWQPNKIDLRWYNGNTLLDVQSSANTCVYDSTLIIPSTAPSRIGYTFAGWTVRQQMDFRTILTNERGTERWARGTSCKYWGNSSSGSAWYVPCNNSDFDDLQLYEWKVKFSHGYLYGMSGCSTTEGTRGQTGTPTIANGTGEYCWCKATGYKAINGDVIVAPAYKLPWVFYSSGTCAVGTDGCLSDCANVCANSALVSSSFRSTLFTPVQ